MICENRAASAPSLEERKPRRGERPRLARFRPFPIAVQRFGLLVWEIDNRSSWRIHHAMISLRGPSYPHIQATFAPRMKIAVAALRQWSHSVQPKSSASDIVDATITNQKRRFAGIGDRCRGAGSRDCDPRRLRSPRQTRHGRHRFGARQQRRTRWHAFSTAPRSPRRWNFTEPVTFRQLLRAAGLARKAMMRHPL